MGLTMHSVHTSAPDDSRATRVGHELQRVRRLDWRFLLPDPRLGRVAYFGASSSALLDSLREFCAAVVVLPSDVDATVSPPDFGSVQLLVACCPTTPELWGANALLQAGGHVYLELDRSISLRTVRRPLHEIRSRCPPVGGLSALRRVLRKLGYDEIDSYAHLPDFNRCQRILPLRECKAGGSALLDLRGALRHLDGARLRPVLLRAVWPWVSVVARKQSSTAEVA